MTKDKKNQMTDKMVEIATRTMKKHNITFEDAMQRVINRIATEYPTAIMAYLKS